MSTPNDPRYRVGIAGIPPNELGDKMREAIQAVQRILPGATLALFAFDPPGAAMGLSYIATGDRSDVAKAVTAWAARQNSSQN